MEASPPYFIISRTIVELTGVCSVLVRRKMVSISGAIFQVHVTHGPLIFKVSSGAESSDDITGIMAAAEFDGKPAEPGDLHPALTLEDF